MTVSHDRSCVFCLDTNRLSPSQILHSGQHMYLCAPLGQIVEGYLIIAPYQCVRSFSWLSKKRLEELCQLKNLVASFYREEYGAWDYIAYEQGRGGAGLSSAPENGFPLHAHLCCLPINLDLHSYFSEQLKRIHLRDLDELPSAVGREPYLYLETNTGLASNKAAYVATSPPDSGRLENMRLKPIIASLMNLPPQFGDWRTHPGNDQIANILARFEGFQQRMCVWERLKLPQCD